MGFASVCALSFNNTSLLWLTVVATEVVRWGLRRTMSRAARRSESKAALPPPPPSKIRFRWEADGQSRLKKGGRRKDGEDGPHQGAAYTETCECGVSLAGCSPEDVRSHLLGTRHATNLRRVQQRLLVAENCSEYRRVIEGVVLPADRCLEVGCGRGVTTSFLAEHGASAVGVDLSAKVIEMAKSRFSAIPNLAFQALDAVDLHTLRALGPFDVIFLDINGDRELQTLLPVIEKYEAALTPRLIVVKSSKLKRLLLRAQSVAELLQNDATDGGRR